MYEDIYVSIRNAAEKRNLRERTIQLYCSDVNYFLRCTNKPVDDLTLEDADAFLTMKRLNQIALLRDAFPTFASLSKAVPHRGSLFSFYFLVFI